MIMFLMVAWNWHKVIRRSKWIKMLTLTREDYFQPIPTNDVYVMIMSVKMKVLLKTILRNMKDAFIYACIQVLYQKITNARCMLIMF